MMLWIILIFLVGKSFYELAARHKKSRWAYAILGVVSYYLGTLIAGFLMAILSELDLIPFYEYPENALGIIAFPFGVALCWGTYAVLRHIWTKPKNATTDEVLDGDMLK